MPTRTRGRQVRDYERELVNGRTVENVHLPDAVTGEVTDRPVVVYLGSHTKPLPLVAENARTATYSHGYCPACRQSIIRGDRIADHAQLGVIHVPCTGRLGL